MTPLTSARQHVCPAAAQALHQPRRHYRRLTVPHKLLAVRLDVGKVLLGLRCSGGTQTLRRGGGAMGDALETFRQSANVTSRHGREVGRSSATFVGKP